jgi:Ran GTPase-activating protein (RanGAP) involved in mRNA processing and transport
LWSRITRLFSPAYPKPPLWDRAYDRGFVNRISIQTDSFLSREAELVRVAPIEHLTLQFATPEHHQALVTSPSLPRLVGLGLGGSGVDDTTLAELARGFTPGRLKELTLDDNEIGDRGVQALAVSGVLRGVTTLILCSNSIGPLGAQTLAALDLPELHTLRLGFNPLGDEGIEALAASPGLANLCSLDLEGTGISPVGAHALAASPHLNELLQIHLHDAILDNASRQALMTRFPVALITF